MTDFAQINRALDELLARVSNPRSVAKSEALFCGLDVGTAFIVLVVVDADGRPVACAYRYADVVRDGMVVDYIGACDIARTLKASLEDELGVSLCDCAVALPPGTEALDGGVVKNVAESAGFTVVAVFDEPTAANRLINATDGAVVDIGGGTTGISIVQDGRVVQSVDESTGGTHFSLVIAGARNTSFDEAEAYKCDVEHHAEILPLVYPTIDKIAGIIERAIKSYRIADIFLVGGTAELTGIEKRLERDLNCTVHKPNHPMFVTPFGIALGCRVRVQKGGADGH